MKKTLVRLALVVGIGTTGLVAAMPTAVAEPDAKGPECAEILRGSGTYTFGETPLTRVVRTRLELEAPACADITYTFTVSYTTTTGVPVQATTTEYVAADAFIEFTVSVPELDAPNDVTGTATTSKRKRAYDETSAPISFDIGGSGGGSYQG